jgi:hypothetical protein
MTAFVFLGPTIKVSEAEQLVDAVFLPPVAQGDVYRATLRRPKAIAIVDGFFDHICSVWHKEILWALHQGIHVFGAASMGALRAAELDDFGMVGIGRIYEAYRDGVIDDDDEVAVLHGPPESGYRSMTEAMVNIRATVDAACAAGVLQPGAAMALLEATKSAHYSDRCYPPILAAARSARICSPDELDAFEAWLPTGRVDQKHADAVSMLSHVAAFVAENPPPHVAEFDFEYTTLFDSLRRSAGELDLSNRSGREALLAELVLDEVRLAGRWAGLGLRAVARRLALEEGRRQGTVVDDDALLDEVIRFRRNNELVEREDLERWMGAANVDGSRFLRLMREDATVRQIVAMLESEMTDDMLDLLRLDGTFRALADRALAKREIFALLDARPPGAEVYEQAVAWLLDEWGRTGAGEEPWQARGFATADAFNRAVVGEYLQAQRRERARST